MKRHFFIRAIAKNLDTRGVVDKTFDVWAWSEWEPGFRQDYGHLWRIIEVLSVEEVRPDEVLA